MSKVQEMSKESLKYAHCSRCGKEIRISESSVSGICYMCIMSKLPVDESLTKIKSDKPRGWAFMKMYVDKDGNVFELGIEKPELKGLHEPTDVEALKSKQKKKKVKTKAEKQKEQEERDRELIGIYNEKKKEKSNSTEVVKVKKIKRK